MDPQQVTSLNPIAMAFTLALMVALAALPRRFAVVPILMMASYMTAGQGITVGSLHFPMLRLLLLAAIIRVVARQEFRKLRWNSIDTAVTMWMIASVTVYTILWGTTEALIYKCGYIYDAAGLYFLFRCLVSSVDDVVRVSKIAAVVITPLAMAMLAEKLTGRNGFWVFGGVPLITDIRDGVLRCQGPFPHSILAGTFGAIWVPFFLGLMWRHQWALGILGLGSSTMITIAAGSSGPVLTYVAGLVGCAMWLLRRHMRKIRWGVVMGLGVLQLFMKAPVWFVIAHAGLFSGSTAYYRAFLIDRAIANFGEWWLIGTRYPHPWGPLLTDITDMYVRVAMDGGLITLILFFLIFKRCFARVGRYVKSRDAAAGQQRNVWVLGAVLFAHAMTFVGVWYWDFNIVNWYLALAMISGAAMLPRKVQSAELAVTNEPETEPRHSDLSDTMLRPADHLA
jgi:hypothetical protein